MKKFFGWLLTFIIIIGASFAAGLLLERYLFNKAIPHSQETLTLKSEVASQHFLELDKSKVFFATLKIIDDKIVGSPEMIVEVVEADYDIFSAALNKGETVNLDVEYSINSYYLVIEVKAIGTKGEFKLVERIILEVKPTEKSLMVLA